MCVCVCPHYYTLERKPFTLQGFEENNDLLVLFHISFKRNIILVETNLKTLVGLRVKILEKCKKKPLNCLVSFWI